MALELIADAIPRELAAWDHFLLWNWVLRKNGKGEQVWTKPPYRLGGGLAKSTDADGWGSFTAAMAARNAQRMAGIGFALSPDDPFCFGDLDDCIDLSTGEIAAWAQKVIERFKHSYIERSPSGTGIKILVKGKLPGTEHRWRLDKDNPAAYVEWFDSAKYTTLTGHRLPESGADIADAQTELDALYRLCFPPRTVRVSSNGSTPPVSTDDDDIRLTKARSSRQGADFMRLFDAGDIAPYGKDHSVADLALCGMLAFWFGPDAGRIDRMFRRSKLMRDKWDERQDYRDATIAEALSGRTEFYTPPADRRLKVVKPEDAATETPQRQTRWTAAELLATELPEPRWAVPDLIPEGLTILAGRPKKGKSRLALDIALAVASGLPALGHFDVDNGGNVLFAGLEDGPRRLQERLQDMLGKRAAPPNLELWIDLPKLGEGCEEAVERWITEHPNARLIVIDTYQRIRKPATGRDGNPYAIDYQEAARLQTVAMTGRVAVVLILHTRKPVGGLDPFDDVLGSTGNTAAADALMLLQTEHGKADAKLLVTGRDIEQAEHALTSDAVSGRWTRIGQAADVRRSGQRQAILSVLRLAGEAGLRPAEIAHATKQRSGNVRYLLFRMKNDGEVYERDRVYVCTESRFAANADDALTLTPSKSAKSPAATRESGAPEALGGSQTANASGPFVSGVSADSGNSGVRSNSGVSGSWQCPCGCEVLGHLAHCPLCGESRP